MVFITDTFRLLVMGNVPTHEIEQLLDADIEMQHQEGMKPGMILQKIGDSMPGLGIVAAGPGHRDHHAGHQRAAGRDRPQVAAALVGTFLGIFISYGFLQPLATNLDLANDDESRIFEVIKSGIIATAKGLNPIAALEFARRVITDDYRPAFQEMENFVKGNK